MLQTLIRCYFSPISTTGQKCIFSLDCLYFIFDVKKIFILDRMMEVFMVGVLLCAHRMFIDYVF